MNLFYKIGEFAKLCGVTIKTLRHYETIGILVPSQIDEWTGYRYYHVGQMQRMERIRNLKAAGLSLDEIGELLDSESLIPSQDLLHSKILQTEMQLNELQQRKQRLLAMVDSRKRINEMKDITIQSLPEIIVAYHRATIDSYEQLGELCCNIIGPEMARLGCQCPEPGYCFTWETDLEYHNHNINIEYCEQVTEARIDSDIIKFKKLEAVPKAICLKVYGPYDQLQQKYIELFAYIEKENYHISGAPRASYVDGIWNQSDPNKWLTIIQIPVEKNTSEHVPLNRLRLFCCPECGNVALAYGKTTVECCGQNLEPLKTRRAEEEEFFKASEIDGEYLLEYNNPMKKESYIAGVVVERYDNTSLYRLFPEQEATVRIPMLIGSKIYTIYRNKNQVWATLQQGKTQ